LGASRPNSINKFSNIGYGHLCLGEQNLIFINNYTCKLLTKLHSNFFFVLGWFNDLTGSWFVSFYTIGGLQILSSVIIFIERLLWKLKQKTDPVGIGQMEHTKTTETSLLEENIPMMDHNIK